MPVDEVTILRDDDPILNLGDSSDLAIRCSVAIRQFRSVHDVVSQLDQHREETNWQLRVDQQTHLRR
jgi:hypothetical protein